jgi:hypothetical protein
MLAELRARWRILFKLDADAAGVEGSYYVWAQDMGGVD